MYCFSALEVGLVDEAGVRFVRTVGKAAGRAIGIVG